MLVDENECICALLIKLLAQMCAYFLVMNSKRCNASESNDTNDQLAFTWKTSLLFLYIAVTLSVHFFGFPS